MIGRYTGAILGMLAFSVSIVAGLWAGNPATVILSRAIWALIVFCVIGLVCGGIAQFIVSDYAKRRHSELLAEHEKASPQEPQEESINSSTEVTIPPMGT